MFGGKRGGQQRHVHDDFLIGVGDIPGTLSSSMGRFVYFHNYALSERGHFDFASLDTAKMGGGRRGYVPNPIAA